MNMDSKDHKEKGRNRLFSSFLFAIHGISYGLQKEKNFKIHILASILVIFCSFLLKISQIEWLFVILSIFGVFTLELVNSAIERVVDLVTSEKHPLAKQSKDLAAGAVLVYAIMTVIVGCIIFLPKFAHLFSVYIRLL
jgi:undecaprenol kinase